VLLAAWLRLLTFVRTLCIAGPRIDYEDGDFATVFRDDDVSVSYSVLKPTKGQTR